MSTAFAPHRFSSVWADERATQVLDLAADIVAREARSSHQARLLTTALVGLRQQAQTMALFPAIHLPLLVHAGLNGDDGPALPLAAATSLLFLGVDICDDLADGDCPAHLAGYRPAELSLAAATLLCAVPQLALARLDAPSERLAAMQQDLAAGLLRMGAGQATDLALTGGDAATTDEVITSVAGKSGEEAALFAVLAARFADAPDTVTATYAAYGRALGTAAQLASDCYDLFTAAHSRDLASGTRTLPIALHLERLAGAERAAFLDQLAQARTEPSAQAAVRARLRAAGELRRCALIVEVECQRGHRALAEAAPHAAAHEGLRVMIDQVSFFPKGAQA